MSGTTNGLFDEPASIRCSLESRKVHEELAGTSPLAAIWVLVEQPGHWGRDALTDSLLPTTVADHLRSLAVDPTLKVLLTRHRTRTVRNDQHERVVWISYSGSHGSALVTKTFSSVTELASLVVPETGIAAQEAGWVASHGAMAFICTHSGRDACCALYGRALVTQVSDVDEQVWECSHIGGHRFAPTALFAPGNYVMGRCDEHVVREWLDGQRVSPEALRGTSHLPPHQQAAQAFVLRAHSDLSPQDLFPAPHPNDPSHIYIHATDGRSWRVVLERVATDHNRPESCDGSPSAVEHFTLTQIEQL